MAITWMYSFFYEQDKSIAKKLKKLVARYPEHYVAWSPSTALTSGEDNNNNNKDDDNDEKGKDENGREFCPFLHYFPPSCCSFALTLVCVLPVDFTILRCLHMSC